MTAACFAWWSKVRALERSSPLSLLWMDIIQRMGNNACSCSAYMSTSAENFIDIMRRLMTLKRRANSRLALLARRLWISDTIVGRVSESFKRTAMNFSRLNESVCHSSTSDSFANNGFCNSNRPFRTVCQIGSIGFQPTKHLAANIAVLLFINKMMAKLMQSLRKNDYEVKLPLVESNFGASLKHIQRHFPFLCSDKLIRNHVCNSNIP